MHIISRSKHIAYYTKKNPQAKTALEDWSVKEYNPLLYEKKKKNTRKSQNRGKEKPRMARNVFLCLTWLLL